MKTTRKPLRILAIMIGTLLISTPLFALGIDQAKTTKISGSAMFKKAGEEGWNRLTVGAILSQGDSLKTEAGSEVTMDLRGANKTAQIVVREKSQFIFKTFQHDEGSKVDTTLLDVSLGGVLVRAEKLVGSSKFEVKTPTSIVGIRGTTFEVKVD